VTPRETLQQVREAGTAFGTARVQEVLSQIFEDECDRLQADAMRAIVLEELRLEREGYSGKAVKFWRKSALNAYRAALARKSAELNA
jgi:hypothetical protein